MPADFHWNWHLSVLSGSAKLSGCMHMHAHTL